MVLIHHVLTNVIILYMLICAGWGLFNAFRHRVASDSYRTTRLIGEALFVVQAPSVSSSSAKARLPLSGSTFPTACSA